MQNLARDDSGSLEKLEREHNDYVSRVDDPPVLSEAAEKRLIRKIDYKLVPFLSLLYLLSFLDRVNISQARLDGLEKDLGLKGNQFQIALLVFFVGYVVTEIPSNIALKHLKPSRFIPAVMLIWGIIMTLMGLCTSFGGLVAARFCLGLAESPLFPGICYYLVSWYKRDESNLRIAIFFSSATLAGAFGGILAWAISHMGGIGGKGGWAWIFIIEGLMTVVVALVSPWFIEDFPEDAKFLSPKEKEFVVHRLKQDVGAGGHFDWRHVKSAFLDWKSYVFALIYIGIAMPLYALSLFSPTIIAELGKFNRPQSMLLSTPPYVLAFFITLASSFLSDRIKQRGYFNVFWMTVVCIGYAILLGIDVVEKPGVAYFAVFLCVGGVAPCIANNITWTGNSFAGTLKRGTAMGIMFTTGNSGGIISSVVYRTQDKPKFIMGHAICLAFAAMAVFLSLFMRIYLAAENKRRDEKYGKVPESVIGANGIETSAVRDDPVLRAKFGLEGMTEEEIELLGDKSPFFRYYL
ncbi:transporter [Rhodotorula sp. JG-1b]|nr:transporter [Rhodotorula sp. JG-1b]